MKTPFSVTVIFFFATAYSQEVKVYDGDYKQGKAKYQYYENKEFGTVFDGSFTYTKGNDVSVTGNFEKNKKKGQWSYSNKNQKTKGQYTDDKKNGVWTFSRTQLVKNKEKTTKITLNFKNDTVVGKVDLPNLKGEFDKSGKFIGAWSHKKDDTEFIAEFKENVIVKLIEKRISDGVVFSRYTPNLDSISVDKMKILSNSNQTMPFSERSGFITRESVNVLGAQKDGTPATQMVSFLKFIWAVKKEFQQLDYDAVLGIYEYNYTKVKTPELLIDHSIRPDKEVGSGTGSPRQGSYAGVGSGNGTGYSLGNRKASSTPKPDQLCNEAGRVAVQVTVDRSGNTTNVVAGVRGTTNTIKCLLEQAKKAALQTKWEPDSNAPEAQIGTIIYTFTIN